MPGLPKKYAKMGFKKGWKAFKATKRKTKAKRKSGNPKKKITKKRKNNPKKKNNPGGRTTPKGPDLSSPSAIAKMYALAGAGINNGMAAAKDPNNAEIFAKNALANYTGFNLNTNQIEAAELTRGWGGVTNDILWRKFAKAMGFKAYPAKNPKNLSQMLDYATMFGAPAIHAAANKDNVQEANRQVYQSLYGVDLGVRGFDAYQPAEMLQTKLPYTIKKIIFKFARQAGYKI